MNWEMILAWLFLAGLIFTKYYETKKKKRQSQIYTIIVNADSEEIPIQKIMGPLQLEYSTVARYINSMSGNGIYSLSSTSYANYPLLRNSYIDIEKQALILSKERLEKQRRKTSNSRQKQDTTKHTEIECKHCGAINKNNTTSKCEYCGSPLK